MRGKVDVPGEFIFMQMGLHQVTAGITVLVAQFALTDSNRKELDRTMRHSFQGEARSLKGGGYRRHSARDRKEAALSDLRRRLHSAGARWIESNLPGAFAGLDDETLPIWDLVLTKRALLFDESAGGRDWRDTLGFGFIPTHWEVPDSPGLHLLSPRSLGREEGVPTFTGRSDELLDLQRENERNVHSLAQHLNGLVDGVLALWTVERVIGGYERHFASSPIHSPCASPGFV